MRALTRYLDVLFLVAAGVVLALLVNVRAVDSGSHVSLVAGFEGLQTKEAHRDDELMALRYGLSTNYDRLRAIETELSRLYRTVGGAPGIVSTGPESELVQALAHLEDGLDDKHRRVEDFVSDNAMLSNALRGLPRVAARLIDSARASGDDRLVTDVERLVGTVSRFSLTAEESIRTEAAGLLDALGEVQPRLQLVERLRLDTLLFLAKTILTRQTDIDRALREILSLDTAARLDRASVAYRIEHERIQRHVASTRWWLFGCCIALLFYALLKHAHIRRLHASIERKVVERTAELVTSREQFRSLVETTQALPWRFDDETWRFTYVGPQAASLLGCPASTWLEAGFWDARVQPEDSASARQRWANQRGSEEDVEFEFRLRHDDGHWVWVRSVVSGARVGGQSRHLQGFMLDITERRRIELELQQAQKLESVGRLASGVAHEINTPIQFVSDSVHFLRDALQDLLALGAKQRALRQAVQDGRDAEALTTAAADVAAAEEAADLEYLTENVPKALERSLDGLDRVATIVRSMKAFAHPDQTEMTQVDLNQAIKSTLIIARNEYKYVADVDCDFGELPPVACHVGDINQAVLNIVVNAAHAIADVVEGKNHKGVIRVRTRVEGEYVEVRISDTGGGIPDHVRNRMFDPYFTTKAVGKGTGQGLAIARSVVVDKHKGEIQVETEVGVGTTLIIRLPMHGPVLAKVAA